jgi:L-ascorbate metabolism protein UlaG (beta-lactamase superfamily)
VERLTWLGHSTVLIETAGARILTDPLLRGRVAHLRRHAPAPAVPERLDAVLVSHLHHDHLDPLSLRAVSPSAVVVVPRGAGRSRTVRRLHRDVHELAPGESLAIAGARVRAVPAAHDDRRLPLTRRAAALGFVVEGGHRVYFAGDTELFAGMRTIAGGVHAALLPVWGWGGRLGPGHMDPDQAAQAAALVSPTLAVPIHWGTYLPLGLGRRAPRLLRLPGEVFAGRVAERAPHVRVAVLAPGQSLALECAER